LVEHGEINQRWRYRLTAHAEREKEAAQLSRNCHNERPKTLAATAGGGWIHWRGRGMFIGIYPFAGALTT
jgi:hypothetical protein